MNNAKKLTELYINCIKQQARHGIPDEMIAHIRDALIIAQKLLSESQNRSYVSWHKHKWPNLDW